MKEPNNFLTNELVLNWISSLESEAVKPFGKIDLSKVKLARYAPLWRRQRFWLIVTTSLLFFILTCAVLKGRKDLFFGWHAVLLIAKRLLIL